MSTHAPKPIRPEIPSDARIAIVAARFNAAIVDKLIEGCTSRLRELGVSDTHVEIHRVPGAFELPLVAKVAAQSKRFAGIICLGCVIRGDTPHFDYVAGEAARGIAQVALEGSMPVIFGVLTTNTEQQALDRVGGPHGHAGERTADAVVEMLATLHEIRAGRVSTRVT